MNLARFALRVPISPLKAIVAAALAGFAVLDRLSHDIFSNPGALVPDWAPSLAGIDLARIEPFAVKLLRARGLLSRRFRSPKMAAKSGLPFVRGAPILPMNGFA